MAGSLKVNSVQLGDSATATQNFVWQTNVNGTAKLARGNVGATTQDILTVDASGNAVMPQGVSVYSMNGGQLAGLRNRFINGGMQIAQRGSVEVVSNVDTYGVDRWMCHPSLFTTATGSMFSTANSSFASGYGFIWSATTTGSGNVYFTHRIEARNSVSLNSKTITISFKVYQDSGSTTGVNVNIHRASVADYFGAPILVSAASIGSLPSGVFTSFSLTTTLGSTSGTNGLQIAIQLTGLGALTAANIIIGDAQLEVGSVATPFEQRPYGMELALCQRYYTKSFDSALGTAPGDLGALFMQPNTNSTTAFDVTLSVRFPVAMRTAPTVTGVNPTQGWGNSNWRLSSDSGDVTTVIGDISTQGMRVRATGLPAQQFARGHYQASAEL